MKLTGPMLEAKMKKVQNSLKEGEEADFEKADVSRLWSFIDGRIEKKAPAKQAELYGDLAWKLAQILKEMPTGETKLRELFKDFKSNSL